MTQRPDSITRKRALAGIGAVAGAAAAAGPTLIFAADRQKVNVAVGAEHALVYLPWDLAIGLGYFTAEGLDVNVTYTKGGSEASLALVSGSVDYSGNAIDHAIAAQARGKSLVMIADFMGQPGITLLIRPQDKDKYRSVKDLKGKAVGVTTIGAATHVIALWMAHRAGLTRDDIKIIGVGGGGTAIAALSGGTVDAAFGNDPFVTQMVRSGRGIPLVDLFVPAQARTAMGYHAYCFTGALSRGEVVAKNPQTTQKIVNALVRAMKFMSTHSSTQIASSLNDELRGGVSIEEWAPGFSHSRPAYTNHGEISLEGVRAVIETNAYFLNEDAAKVDASKLYDNTFVEKAYRTVKV
jgi:NitT/TauT family transport system substrate-binding protein